MARARRPRSEVRVEIGGAKCESGRECRGLWRTGRDERRRGRRSEAGETAVH